MVTRKAVDKVVHPVSVHSRKESCVCPSLLNGDRSVASVKRCLDASFNLETFFATMLTVMCLVAAGETAPGVDSSSKEESQIKGKTSFGEEGGCPEARSRCGRCKQAYCAKA